MMDHLYILLDVVLIIICAAARITSADAATSPVTCDFEAGMCGWYSGSSGGYIFHRHTGPTDDRTSGPDTDHTLPDIANGHYVYTTGWEANDPQDTTTLLSPPLTLLHPATLTLWYQMKGHGVGTLSLSMYQLTVGGAGEGGGRSRAILLWTIRGRQGLRCSDVGRTSAKHSYGSDIAIDDISLSEATTTTTTITTQTHTQTTASTTWNSTSSLTNVINNVTSTSAGSPSGTTEGKKTTAKGVTAVPQSPISSHLSTRTPVGSSEGPGDRVRNAIIGTCVGLLGLAGALALTYVYKRFLKNKVRHIDEPTEKKDEGVPSTSGPASTRVP
ncbi:hypothetical protein ACOMHN_057125 [Nucella lapillus]